DEGSSVLSAGAIARTVDGELMVEWRAPADAEEVLSWRSGYLVFDAEPLEAAIAEFGRYSPRQVVIADPRIASLKVSGKFRANKVEAFIRVICEGFGIEAREDGGEIVLTR